MQVARRQPSYASRFTQWKWCGGLHPRTLYTFHFVRGMAVGFDNLRVVKRIEWLCSGVRSAEHHSIRFISHHVHRRCNSTS